MNLRIQMNKTYEKSISFSTVWLMMLTVLIGTGTASAQIVTHKRDIKLPGRLLNVPHLAISDSGLGATDLDTMLLIASWKSRFLVTPNRLYPMHEKEDGTAYFGGIRQSDVQSTTTAVVERHINTNSSYSVVALFGMIGIGNHYNVINLNGQVLERWFTNLPSARAIVYGGSGTSIVCTGASYILNGVDTRLASINQNTREITPFSGDVVVQTGKNIGESMQMAYGADDMLYLFDLDNRRILKFDTGVRGGTRGAFLGTFDLDSNRPAINSMTVDLVGNFYVGSDDGGFNIYGSDGQWKQSVEGIYRTDPNSQPEGYKPYMNFYASGLNDGNGTLDVRDATGYRQYNIIALGQTVPIRITSEPQARTTCLLSPTSLSVVADGTNLTYQWRRNGVDLTDGGTISDATTANLNLSSTDFSDAGYYDVLIRKTGAIVTSQAASITVTPTPVITLQPAAQSLQLGDDATFTATADHAPGVQWQISTDGGVNFTDIDGATNETLIVPSVSASNIGNYYRAVFSALCGSSVTSLAATLKLSQMISFDNPGTKIYGDSAFDLGGTASSNLPISYTVVFGPATVVGNVLTITNSGIVSVRASQNGNAYYTAAPDVTQTFTVMRPDDPAAPYTVDTASDDVTLSACTSALNDCSLRAAVLFANSSASDDTINFDSSLVNQIIVLNSQTASFAGQLNIAGNGELTINGLGTNQLTISGDNTSRVFFIEENAVAAVSDLTITGGFSGGGNGGGIYSNNGTLRLIRSVVTGNSTGGGIFKAAGTLTITDSTVSDNSTIGSSGNGAGDGGGIFAVAGTTTLTNSTISGNRALGTLSGGTGGGIFNGGDTLALINSTISDNKAGAGGGVYIGNYSSGATTLTNVTVTNNLNRGGSVGNTYCGGVYNAGPTTITVSNSIIANNGTAGGVFDVKGFFISEGYNLIGNVYTSSSNSNYASGFGATGDKFGSNGTKLDALLLPLNNYGGLTQTHALTVGSPAVDAGNGILTIDQRGFARPFDNLSVTDAAGGNGADIGAVEFQSVPTAATVSISGRVITPQDLGLTNALVTLTDSNGNSQTVRTGKFGKFRFIDIQAGETYILTVTAKRCTYAPQVINVTEDMTELNFSPQ